MLGAEILIAEGEIVDGGGDSNCGRGRLLMGAEILIAEGGDGRWGPGFELRKKECGAGRRLLKGP